MQIGSGGADECRSNAMEELRLGYRLVQQALRRVGDASADTIHVTAGALSNISPAVLRRQMTAAAAGTSLAGARVVFHVGNDPLAPDALRVFVSDVQIAA